MLSLVSVSLSFQAPGVFMNAPARAAVSMGTGAMADTFLFGAPTPIGTMSFDADFTGKVVKTNAPVAAPETAKPKKAIKSAEWNFVYGRMTDSSVGPPCGVCYHQGSGTGPGQTIPGRRPGENVVGMPGLTAVDQGNCMSDECQIG